jgi:hypothetical protein
MGQYFKFICLLNETFLQFIEIFCHEGGSKFLEMAHVNNYYMLRMEKLLSQGGLWYKQRVVLAGEYAENEKNHEVNLHVLTLSQSDTGYITDVTAQNINPNTTRDKCIEEFCTKENEFRYIINHDTSQYVDKQKCTTKIHPLAILLEEGYNNCGEWSRQRLSVQNDIPENFSEYELDESEYEYLSTEKNF